MKYIPLRNSDLSAIVDDEDYEHIVQRKWYLLKAKHTNYATTRKWNKKKKKIDYFYMHREMLKVPKGLLTDYIDHNGLNNQKSNLRMCSSSENNRNRRAHGSSKYLGVCVKKETRIRKTVKGEERVCNSISIIAKIVFNGKEVYIGAFKTEEDAAKAYNNAAKKYHGEFANLNIVS